MFLVPMGSLMGIFPSPSGEPGGRTFSLAPSPFPAEDPSIPAQAHENVFVRPVGRPPAPKHPQTLATRDSQSRRPPSARPPPLLPETRTVASPGCPDRRLPAWPLARFPSGRRRTP
uniref:Uncharacterized protein n=1 Tax=Setaria viridis TaxID=4556 RepID=A0A4U6UEM1_SETVI|nr:hypothetical protein SEVIR_5G171600v2 [Setaria viridis]